MAKNPPKTKPGSNQRALVIGVSDYPNPKDRLPAVAADVREMAKVLSSKHGTFPAKGVTVMADKQATRDKVLAALRSAFGGTAVDTVFVYLAGHGVEVGGRYYYVAHDTTTEATAVPLTEIKALFEQTKSRRAFLWLDFCHSGGILARGGSNDMAAIRREIGVDLSIGTEYRPLLSNNIILTAGAATLIPGRGFRDLYSRFGGGVSAPVSGFIEAVLLY